MKKGYQDCGILLEGDEFAGLSLGWDFTSEHEWGIKGIKEAFGVYSGDRLNRKVVGIDRRKITNIPDLIQGSLTIHGRTYLYLCLSPDLPWYDEERLQNYARDTAKRIICSDEDDVAAAWDEKSFLVAVAKEFKDNLDELNDAIQRKNLAIYLGGGSNPFSNAGLLLVIASKINKEVVNKMREVDLDYIKLHETAENTGIFKKFEKNKKKYIKSADHLWNNPHGYFALSPRWKTEDYETPTKYDVVFWLNPMQQHKNNYGLYTVEELELWLQDKGPIPKKIDESSKK